MMLLSNRLFCVFSSEIFVPDILMKLQSSNGIPLYTLVLILAKLKLLYQPI